MTLMMDRILRYRIFILIILLMGMAPITGFAAQQKNVRVVLLDPAHGGEETGVLADKMREKDLNLQVALLLRDEAKKIPGLELRLTRSADRSMSVSERILAAGAAQADCIVSLHFNGGFGKKASGYEVYFPGFQQAAGGEDRAAILNDMARNKTLNDSVRLAQMMKTALETVFPRKGRGLREAPNPLLEGVKIPGVVVEMAFATHPDDRKKVIEQETQRVAVRALLRGLQDYFRKTP